MEQQDRELMWALIGQVSAARPAMGSERDVVTRISRPMWRRWCEATGMPTECEPTDWLGIHKTRRVYGSQTIIIESEEYFATSHSTR